MLKKYYVMWTYVSNFGGPYVRMAESPEAAAETIYQGFSDDFRKRGIVHVFESPPITIGPDKGN